MIGVLVTKKNAESILEEWFNSESEFHLIFRKQRMDEYLIKIETTMEGLL